MISILFASFCLTYDTAGECVSRQVWPIEQWEGSSAQVECEQHAQSVGGMVLYCESQSVES